MLLQIKKYYRTKENIPDQRTASQPYMQDQTCSEAKGERATTTN